MTIPVLLDNQDFLAVEKPVGLATVFERRKEEPCLIQSLRDSTGLKLMTVHRLDKDVSGTIVFAKHPEAHRELNLQFDRREVHKTYAAVVHGEILEKEGTVNKPIRQFGSGRMGIDEIKGKESITCFSVKKHNSKFTFLHLMPATGRRHQLRVHMYGIGYPIVGDPLYGDKLIQREFPRLMLHSHRIEFEWKGKHVCIESPVPGQFTEYVA